MAANDGAPAAAGQHPPSALPSAAGPASLVAMRTAWISFYDAEYHAVVRCVMRAGACLEDACDAASQAFLESWELMTSHPERWAQIRNRRAWIRTVALRKRRRPPGPRRPPLLDSNADIPDLPAAGLEPGELTAQTQAVLHALRSLDIQAQAVMALQMERFPVAVIAEMLGITEQRVRDVTKKARSQLKRTLTVAQMSEGRQPQ